MLDAGNLKLLKETVFYCMPPRWGVSKNGPKRFWLV